MQGEIDSVNTAHPIRILGINEAGQESGNSLIVSGRTIPWLQDTDSEHVWSDWKVTYRDVVVLDPENRVAAVYNLTEHDLSVPANYDSLKALLVRVAG
jgi:hypothetical protein